AAAAGRYASSAKIDLRSRYMLSMMPEASYRLAMAFLRRRDDLSGVEKRAPDRKPGPPIARIRGCSISIEKSEIEYRGIGGVRHCRPAPKPAIRHGLNSGVRHIAAFIEHLLV